MTTKYLNFRIHFIFSTLVTKSNFALYLYNVMEKEFTDRELDRIIEMAWEDRTTFDAIRFQFGISEQETIEIMRREMKPSSFRMWRKRVQGRATKHAKLRTDGVDRFKCSRQKQITGNKISKR
jgi:uncharacterized protein (TIGR03643 family)